MTLHREERLQIVREREREQERVRDSVDVSAFDQPTISVQTLDEFADEEEEGAEAILGTADNALFSGGGDVMTYGDGGAGKTTLMADLALHLAAGDPWLVYEVARPLRVLLIENEGPRPRFRVKLRRKRDAWTGSDLGDRVHVLADPWGQFTYADPNWRRVLAALVRELEIDLVICGPLTSAGMDEAGTLQDVRAFLALVDDVRRQAERRFANLLVHHENKGGKVSGAWEGAGDTLLHVQPQGRGRLRLHVQKARWASEYHGTTLPLLWADGESFQIEETPELTDEDVAEKILATARERPGASAKDLEDAIPVRAERVRALRDALLEGGRLVNLGRGNRHAFHAADDPALPVLTRPDPDESRTSNSSATGEHASSLHSSPRPTYRGDEGSGTSDTPPLEGTSDSSDPGRETRNEGGER